MVTPGQYVLNLDFLGLTQTGIPVHVTTGALQRIFNVDFFYRINDGTLTIVQLQSENLTPDVREDLIFGTALGGLVKGMRVQPSSIVLSGKSEVKARILSPTLAQLGYRRGVQTSGENMGDMVIFSK